MLADEPITKYHVWQPDEGFQLAKIRNKGIAASSHEYIIQIDGDLVLHPMFIADHLPLKSSSRVAFKSRFVVLLIYYKLVN